MKTITTARSAPPIPHHVRAGIWKSSIWKWVVFFCSLRFPPRPQAANDFWWFGIRKNDAALSPRKIFGETARGDADRILWMYSRPASAEHFQQCAEFLPLRNRALCPLAVTVLPIPVAGRPTATACAAEHLWH
jgi:hypothetical protein